MKIRLLAAIAGAALGSIVSRALMRRLAVALVLAAFPTMADASATIDRDHIVAGESVTLSAVPIFAPFLSVAEIIVSDNLESLIPPGGHFEFHLYDWSMSSVLTSSFGYAQACSNSTFISCTSGVTDKFPALIQTFDTPGTYEVDWQIASSIGEFGPYQIYDADGQIVTFGLASPFGNGPSEAGSFLITVTSVPEPSTWAMLLLGLAGIGFIGANRRIDFRKVA
jgi:hypothetical protein